MKARLSLPGVLSLIPLGGFCWLTLYAYLAYLQGGYWPPVYGRPDPTSWATGYALMGGLMTLIVASSLSLPLMLWTSSRWVLGARTSQEKIHRWWAFVRQVSVFTLGAVMFATELLRLREWLLD